jgi:hypothetical protein
MHIDFFLKELNKIQDPILFDIISNDKEEINTIFNSITDLISSGKIEYTYSYPMKMLLIRYAKLVSRITTNQ